jgi:predicted ATP-dependent endonuclease of OLD family
MITKLEIVNFRNISHICLDLKKCSILTGANGIGKSNTLNAANWLLTNTLLTDKWGVGENDLNSVFNTNYIKGQDPSVIITLDTGITF